MESLQQTIKSYSDAELREKLQAANLPFVPIIKSTRTLFEKKLLKYLMNEAGLTTQESTDQSEKSYSNKVKDSVQKQCIPQQKEKSKAECDVSLTPSLKRSSSDSFFVVCVPIDDAKDNYSDFATPAKAVSHVFEDRKEAFDLMKRNTGSRFKVFKSREEAEKFAGLQQNLSTPMSIEADKSGCNGLSKASPESPNTFHSLKSQQYVALRRAIQTKNKEKFKELIWSNPKYLISSGETPTILQEGSRYNAVHVASQKNLTEMCTLILDTLLDKEFLLLMYPNEDEGSVDKRRNHIIDLYLNTPDKGNCETPLHFACKFGHVEMVKLLTSYLLCERNLPNRYGQTPAEIIGDRSDKTGKALDKLKEEINEILFPSDEEAYYIPVFRSEDNATPPMIGHPWSPAASENQSASSPDVVSSPIEFEFSVKAYAGPMSPKEASSMYQKWKSPSVKDRKRVADIQRRDEQKGLERIGRELSEQFSVPWVEYWSFLDDYIDLRTHDGLQMLENYLAERYEELEDAEDSKGPGTGRVKVSEDDPVTKNLFEEFQSLDISSSPAQRTNTNVSSVEMKRNLTSQNEDIPEENSLKDDHSLSLSHSILSQSTTKANEYLSIIASNQKGTATTSESDKLTIKPLSAGIISNDCHHDRPAGAPTEPNVAMSEGGDEPLDARVPSISEDGTVSSPDLLSPNKIGQLCKSFHKLQISPSQCNKNRFQSTDSNPFDVRNNKQSVCLSDDYSNISAISNVSAYRTGHIDLKSESSSEEGTNKTLGSEAANDSCSFERESESVFQSPPAKVKEHIYLLGSEPRKVDLDVYRAIQSAIVTSQYPSILMWRQQVEDISEELRQRWPTPRCHPRMTRSSSNPALSSTPNLQRFRRFSPQMHQMSSPQRRHHPLSEPSLLNQGRRGILGMSSPGGHIPIARLFQQSNT